MSETAIRGTVKSTLQGVSGIGVVHDYIRESRSPTKFIELLIATGGTTVNGWMFSRIQTNAEWADFQKISHTHVYTIEGYYEIVDGSGSEKTFQDLISAIQTACDAATALNSLVPAPPLQVGFVGHKEIADKLYHHCILTLSVGEII